MERPRIIIDAKGTEKEVHRLVREPVIYRPETTPDRKFSEYLESISTLQKEHKKFEPFVNETTVRIETPSPFLYVQFLSDIHLDRRDFDLETFKRNLEAIRQYPIFLVILGDIGSFFSPKHLAEGMLEAMITPDEQAEITRSFFREFKDKTLAILPGNHEDFVRRASGIEMANWLVKGLGIPLLKNESLLHLNVNDITYDIYLFHRIGKYYSSLNLTNALRRAREVGMNVDAVIQGHYEVGAMEKLVHRTEKPFLLQLGTFKSEDRYRVEQGFLPRGRIFFPIVRFNTRRKNIEATEDFEQAVEEITYFEKLRT